MHSLLIAKANCSASQIFIQYVYLPCLPSIFVSLPRQWMGEVGDFRERLSWEFSVSRVKRSFFYYRIWTMQWLRTFVATFSIWTIIVGFSYMQTSLWDTPSIHQQVNSSFSFLFGFQISSLIKFPLTLNSKVLNSLSFAIFTTTTLSQSVPTPSPASLTTPNKCSKNEIPFLNMNPIELFVVSLLETLINLLAMGSVSRTRTIGVLSFWIRMRNSCWLDTQMKWTGFSDGRDFRKLRIMDRMGQRGFIRSLRRWVSKRIFYGGDRLNIILVYLGSNSHLYKYQHIDIDINRTRTLTMLNYHKLPGQPTRTHKTKQTHFLTLGSHCSPISLQPLLSLSHITMYPETKLIFDGKLSGDEQVLLVPLTGSLRVDERVWGMGMAVGGGRFVEEVQGRETGFLYVRYRGVKSVQDASGRSLDDQPQQLTEGLSIKLVKLPKQQKLTLNKRILLFLKSGNLCLDSTTQQISQNECLYTRTGCGSVTATQQSELIVFQFSGKLTEQKSI